MKRITTLLELFEIQGVTTVYVIAKIDGEWQTVVILDSADADNICISYISKATILNTQDTASVYLGH